MSELPPNVYRVAQRRFDAIPGGPWAYWFGDAILVMFERLPALGKTDPAREGINTGDNDRFVRLWWEIGSGIGRQERYVPFAKGAPLRPYFDKSDEIFHNDLDQIRLLPGSRIFNLDFAFREAVVIPFQFKQGI